MLEARRVAATVIHGLHGRRRAGLGRELLAIPPLRLRRAGAERRLAPLGARRSSLCARARVGSLAHGLDLAGPLAVDGVRLGLAHRQQARPCAGRRLRAGRSAGARRRARRHSRPDAADREPQRHREDGRGDPARRGRAREPAALFRAVAARRGRRALRSLEPDRRSARDRRATVGDRRARPCRADRRSGRRELPLFRPRRIRRAGRRRQRHRRPRRNLARRLSGPDRAASRRDPRRDRPARLELCHPPHRPAGDRAAARAACAHGRARRAAASPAGSAAPDGSAA